MSKVVLRSYTARKLTQVIVMLALLTCIQAILHIYDTHLERRKSAMLYKLEELQKRAELLQVDVTLADHQVNSWNHSLSKTYANRSGVDLELVKQKVDALKTLHKLYMLDASVTEARVFDNLQLLKTTGISYAILHFKLEAPSDREVVGFLDDLGKGLPGVVQIVDLEIVAVGTAPQSNSSQSNNKLLTPALKVQCTFTAVLYSLQDLSIKHVFMSSPRRQESSSNIGIPWIPAFARMANNIRGSDGT